MATLWGIYVNLEQGPGWLICITLPETPSPHWL